MSSIGSQSPAPDYSPLIHPQAGSNAAKAAEAQGLKHEVVFESEEVTLQFSSRVETASRLPAAPKTMQENPRPGEHQTVFEYETTTLYLDRKPVERPVQRFEETTLFLAPRGQAAPKPVEPQVVHEFEEVTLQMPPKKQEEAVPSKKAATFTPEEEAYSGSMVIDSEAEQHKIEISGAEMSGVDYVASQQEAEKFMEQKMEDEPSPEKAPRKHESAQDRIFRQVAERDEYLQDKSNTLTLGHKFALQRPGVYTDHMQLLQEDGGKRLYAEMGKRHNELVQAKQDLTPVIEKKAQNPPDEECRALQANLAQSTRNLDMTSGGQGGAYRGKGVLVKAKGEGIGELHNQKGNGYALNSENCRTRPTIPLYQENEREAASYEIAKAMGFDHITPPTILAVVENEGFGHISNRLEPEIQKRVLSEAPRDNAKVCSVQKLLPNPKEYQVFVSEQEKKFQEEFAIKNPGKKATVGDYEMYMEQKLEALSNDFEDCNIYVWMTGENDGNKGNFLFYTKPDGTEGISKVDNGLAFPEGNQDFSNELVELPFGEREISEAGKAKIRSLDPNKATTVLHEYGLDETIQATEVRINAMKRIIDEFPNITHREMNVRLGLLNQKGEVYLRNLTAFDLNQLNRLGGAKPSPRKAPAPKGQ